MQYADLRTNWLTIGDRSPSCGKIRALQQSVEPQEVRHRN